MAFSVITENDESQWKDSTGRLYHFPSRYAKFLTPGTRCLYYKGRQKSPEYSELRLAAEPHYFGIAIAGEMSHDEESEKGDRYVQILEYQQFERPVLAKQDGTYLEPIPDNRISNYWRDGVRSISPETYSAILFLAQVTGPPEDVPLNDNAQGTLEAFESAVEGKVKWVYTSKYERDPDLRRAAVRIHGTKCVVCDFDFEQMYGVTGAGFIHIHHIKPIADFDVPTLVNPSTDLAPVCPNCHAMIHRRRDKTLSVDELRLFIAESRARFGESEATS